MLILTRRPGEAVQIGENVRITVLGVQGNRVRFGIDAPRDVPVDRDEIYERKRRAAGGDGGNSPQRNSSAEQEEASTPKLSSPSSSQR